MPLKKSRRRPTSGFGTSIRCGACGWGLTGKLKAPIKLIDNKLLKEKRMNKHHDLIGNPENFEFFWCSNQKCKNFGKYEENYEILAEETLERKKKILEDSKGRIEALKNYLKREEERVKQLETEITLAHTHAG